MSLRLAFALYAALQTPSSQPLGIDDVAWLTGCWEYSSGARTVEEHWLAPRAHSMVNVGRTVQADNETRTERSERRSASGVEGSSRGAGGPDELLIEYELVLIREQEGRLAYEAHPSGQPSAVFLSRTVNDREVVFENPQHDFPQRVGYKRDGDALLAWIEGCAMGR